MTEKEEIIIYPSKLKTFILSLGSLVFVALGILFFVYRQELELPILAVIIVSFVGGPLFGLCFIYYIFRLIKPKPSVIMNEAGIFDNASAIGAGQLKWDEIDSIFTYSYMGQRFLGIIPIDTEGVISRQGPFKRAIMKINKGMVQAPFNIPENILPMSIDELLGKIKVYLD